MVRSGVLFCPKYALKLNKMDQLKAYVKFIYILGDMAFPQTAHVQRDIALGHKAIVILIHS